MQYLLIMMQYISYLFQLQLVCLQLTLNIFYNRFIVSIVDFEQIQAR